MDLFDQIESAKKDLPKVKNISKDLKKHSFNEYQIIAIILFVISFCVGIIFGNLFSTCEASSYFYSDSCLVTEFNFFLMIFIWLVGFIISLFIYSIGHIIALLTQINEKNTNFKL